MLRTILLAAALAGTPVVTDFIEPTVEYTSDSVIVQGIGYDVHESSTEENIVVEITVDLPLGYVVYDNPETAYIDGIKVNEEYLRSDYLVEHYDYTKPLTILVKTTYDKGIAGIVASMQDGNYDYSELLSNPIMVIQGLYYVLAALSIVLGGLGILKSKKYKATSSEQWKTAADQYLETALNTSKEQTIKIMLDFLNTNILPVLKQALTNDQKIIQAIALQTSKDDKAPVAILNLLQEISNSADTDKAINEAKIALEESKIAKDKALAETKQALEEIANSTNTVDSSEGRY